MAQIALKNVTVKMEQHATILMGRVHVLQAGVELTVLCLVCILCLVVIALRLVPVRMVLLATTSLADARVHLDTQLLTALKVLTYLTVSVTL